MDYKNENELEFRDGKSTGVKYLFRGPKIDWGILVLGKGETISKHYHNEVEETFYFLSGSCRMKIDDKEYNVKPGDAFRVEPKKSHYMINEKNEPVKMVFIKSPYIPDDKVSVD
jgi:mannose-6-phosphate isomerase-like protein (cupin superfamily)